ATVLKADHFTDPTKTQIFFSTTFVATASEYSGELTLSVKAVEKMLADYKKLDTGKWSHVPMLQPSYDRTEVTARMITSLSNTQILRLAPMAFKKLGETRKATG
ncbi:MAG: hypothetical protein V4692_14650, partial [Bdellovibrionota bacterium]